MSSRRAKKWVWLLVLVVAAGVKLYEELPQRGSAASIGEPRPDRSAGDWSRLVGASLADHRNNDGDSFHVHHDGEQFELRLYFVDAPEKRRHQYNGDRLRYQGEYFGGLSEGETTAVGQRAKAFTTDLLERGGFTVHTRWQEVFDSGRYYALIELPGGALLSEELVREGLARIYTEGTRLPDGRSEKEFENHLKSLEQDARSQRRGAWGS